MGEVAIMTGSSVGAEVEPRSTVPRTKLMTERIRIEQHSASGLLWLMGWLFTIGILHLPFWKGVLALLVWPFYLGSSLGPLLP